MIQMEILDVIKLILRWFFDKKVRLQLSGYRPEIVCLVKRNDLPERYLIIQPNAEPSIWTPPHEGILLDESIEDAAVRCLSIELGLKESNIQFRRSVWLGKRILPQERWDERDLQYSLRGLFSKHKMVGKAYFGALIIADTDAKIKPNRAEVHNWEWVEKEEFVKRLETNPVDKIAILKMLWQEFVGAGETK